MKGAATILLWIPLLLLGGLAGCDPEPPFGSTPPGNFQGRWIFTESEVSPKTKPRQLAVLLRQDRSERPAQPDGVFMSGTVGPNGIVKGTATGDYFVGTVIFNKMFDSQRAIRIEINAPGAGTAFIRNTPYIANKVPQ